MVNGVAGHPSRRWALNFFTKVTVKVEILDTEPKKCAERERPKFYDSCSIYPGRYISNLRTGWPEDRIPDLENGQLDDATSDFGEAACGVVRDRPWGKTSS